MTLVPKFTFLLQVLNAYIGLEGKMPSKVILRGLPNVEEGLTPAREYVPQRFETCSPLLANLMCPG